MTGNPFPPSVRMGSLFLGLLGCAALAPAGRAITLPEQTAIPVGFTHTINAAKAKAGDAVQARTMQVVLLPDGSQLAKGTLVTGHIVDARPFKFDETPYAAQQASYLAIQFDRVVDHGVPTPIVASVRALANTLDAQEALTPHGIDETDHPGTMTMVGGAHYSPVGKRVTDGVEDDIVGYNKKQGVFAHLLPGGSWDGMHCEGTQTEQSVAIFSPDACGLYGFTSVRLSENVGDGTFRLASTHHTVTLYAGSAALLQVQSAR
jgi:hypothetical protein